MKAVAVEERELKIARKNRRLGVVLIIMAVVLMTASFVLMKLYHFVPTPPK
jgi:hypothetical protein